MYKEIIKRTLDLLFEKKYILMKALLIPFLILCVIEYFSTQEVEQSIGKYNFFILMALSFFVTIIISINVHRILLLKEEDTPTWGIYQFGQREISFIIKGIGLALLIGLTVFILYFISIFLSKIIQSFLGSSISSYYSISVFIGITAFLGMIFSRISLIFPAISIDKPMDFGDAFELTKNYKLLVFVTVLVIPMFFALVVGTFIITLS